MNLRKQPQYTSNNSFLGALYLDVQTSDLDFNYSQLAITNLENKFSSNLVQ